MVDGRMIGTVPDEYCLTSPDRRCVAINGDCPEGFVVMHCANFTSPKCVPLSYNDVEQAERERQIQNPNRCPQGYMLEGEDIEFDDVRGNVGRCVRL